MAGVQAQVIRVCCVHGFSGPAGQWEMWQLNAAGHVNVMYGLVFRLTSCQLQSQVSIHVNQGY